MPLVKTDKGKDALQRREPSLTPRERQIIVLANGKLTRSALGQLMQHDIHAEVERLIQCGYLQQGRAGSGIVPPATMHPSVTTAPRLNTQIGNEQMSVAARAPEQPQQQLGSRRSLAGTKMYIMDMLQLLRDMDASAMAVTIHSSQGETDFIHNVIAAVRLIVQKSGPSYGMRVLIKLREIVPDVHLPSVDALAFELEAGIADA